MTPQKRPTASEMTPADWVARAKDAVLAGDNLGGIAAALVAVAEAQVAGMPTPQPVREREPGNFLAGFREGVRRSARAVYAVADDCTPGSDVAEMLNRVAESLGRTSYGEITLSKEIQ